MIQFIPHIETMNLTSACENGGLPLLKAGANINTARCTHAHSLTHTLQPYLRHEGDMAPNQELVCATLDYKPPASRWRDTPDTSQTGVEPPVGLMNRVPVLVLVLRDVSIIELIISDQHEVAGLPLRCTLVLRNWCSTSDVLGRYKRHRAGR